MGQFLEVFTRRGVSLISIVTSEEPLRSILLMGWIGIFYRVEGVSASELIPAWPDSPESEARGFARI